LSTPTFSIVTPSYNQGEYLDETIRSVLGQEGDFLIDYIVVDGGSTDGSVDIIDRYDQLLRRGEWPLSCRGVSLRWLSEKDAGQSDALMKGFAMAHGAIFAWLNSDDTYLPGALQRVTEAFGETPEAGLIYGDARYCDSAGKQLGNYKTAEFDLDRLACFNIICQPSAFFRREVFREVGGVDRSLHYSMDFDLWIRIARRFRCRRLPQFLSTYRLHDSSKTVRAETLYENGEEALRVTLRHFDWAPLTRVYSCCNSYCLAKLPPWLAGSRASVTLASIACTLFRSLKLNRGIRGKDLKLLNRDNFRKLFKTRLEIMTGARG
jgi:glycosyltransferase involved in cell wall biosynthesis